MQVNLRQVEADPQCEYGEQYEYQEGQNSYEDFQDIVAFLQNIAVVQSCLVRP